MMKLTPESFLLLHTREKAAGRNSSFSLFRRNMPRTWKRMRDQYIDILSEIAASHSGDKKAEWRGVYSGTAFCGTKEEKTDFKEDGFKIAHGLDMSYTLTDFF